MLEAIFIVRGFAKPRAHPTVKSNSTIKQHAQSLLQDGRSQLCRTDDYRKKKHLLYDFIDRKLKDMKSSVRTERSVVVWGSEVGQADRLTKGEEDVLELWWLFCR